MIHRYRCFDECWVLRFIVPTIWSAGLLVQAYGVNVASFAQLELAIRAGDSKIVLSSSITGAPDDDIRNVGFLDKRYPNFPEIPEACLQLDSSESCVTNSTYVQLSRPTLISAASSDIVWDVSNQRRRLLLLHNITLENIRINGLTTDAIPYIWFFAFSDNASLICRNCVLGQACRGSELSYFLQGLDSSSQGLEQWKRGENYAQGSAIVSVASDVALGSESYQMFENTTLLCDENLLYQGPTDMIVRPSDTCQNKSDKGAGYRGTVNFAKSGYRCQAWESQTPNFHTRKPEAYPKASLVSNFCRNPDNSNSAWCYTVDGPRYDYCDIPFCEVAWEVESDESHLMPWWAWLLMVLSILSAAAVVASLVLWRRHRLALAVNGKTGREDANLTTTTLSAEASQLKRRSLSSARSPHLYPHVSAASTRSSRTAPSSNAPSDALRAAIAGMDVDGTQLVLQELVGKGGFGTVYRGYWRGLQVAIKTVVFQDRASSRAQQRAIAEAAITFSLSHLNVVATYYHEIKPLQVHGGGGALDLVDKHDKIQDWKLFLVQEFCEAGSLRNAIDRRNFITSGGQTKLIQCVDCMKDIACGMKYIQSKAIVHGDLNPSNVLLRPAGAPTAAALSVGWQSTGSSREADLQGSGSRDTQLASKDRLHSRIGLQRSISRALRSVAAAPGSAEAALPDSAGDRPHSTVQNDPSSTLGPCDALECGKGLTCTQSNDDSVVSRWAFNAKVSDFGLAVKMDPSKQFMSNLRQGTPFYIAPEVRKSGHLGFAADSHAFGVMMWECYHSAAPYRIHGDRLIRRRGFPRYPKDCPLSYAVLATSCLAEDPSMRPNFWQILGVLEDLSQHLKGNSDTDTATAHVTLAQLEQMEMSGSIGDSTPVSRSQAMQTRAASAIEDILTRAESQVGRHSKPASDQGLEGVPTGSALLGTLRSVTQEGSASSVFLRPQSGRMVQGALYSSNEAAGPGDVTEEVIASSVTSLLPTIVRHYWEGPRGCAEDSIGGEVP